VNELLFFDAVIGHIASAVARLRAEQEHNVMNSMHMPIAATIRVLVRPLLAAVALGGILASVGLLVAAAVGDMLVGSMAAVMVFILSAPALGPVLGADSRSAR
jgi:hypothetical protein